MPRIPCERCPVRLALQAEQQNPGALYKLQEAFADAVVSKMGYTCEEYGDYLQTVSEGMEASVEECPGMSRFKYYLGKIGTRFLRYSNKLLFSRMPGSMEAGEVCRNPYLAGRPEPGPDADFTQDIRSIWIEY